MFAPGPPLALSGHRWAVVYEALHLSAVATAA